MNKRPKILITSAVVLVLAAALGYGSFATFSAETDNPSNSFAYGTLVLSNTKQGGTACLSTGGAGNVNPNCDTLLNLALKKPGDSGSANVTLKNVGTIDASSFKVFSPACTAGDSGGETYHGAGNPCSVVQLYIQQWTDNTFTTAQTCLYGGASGNTCDFSDTSKTLGSFASTYSSSASGLSIGSGLNANASAYITIGVKSPTGADNSYQGRQASLDFDWIVS